MILYNPPIVARSRARGANLLYAPAEFSSAGIVSKVANVLHYHPWYSGERGLISRLAFEPFDPGTVGCNVRLGIYSIKNYRSDFAPDRLIASTAVVVLAGPGLKQIPLTAPYRLRRRAWYWLAVWSSQSMNYRVSGASLLVNRLNIPLPATGLNAGNIQHIGISPVAGLPDPAPVYAPGTYWNTETPLIAGEII